MPFTVYLSLVPGFALYIYDIPTTFSPLFFLCLWPRILRTHGSGEHLSLVRREREGLTGVSGRPLFFLGSDFTVWTGLAWVR